MAFPYQEIVVSLEGSSPAKYLALTPSRLSRFYSGKGVFDPKAKLIVENIKAGGGLVHIRSTNNKYWTRDLPGELIKAIAEKPNEDQSSPECTLFRAVLQGGNSLRLVHIQLGRNVGRINQGDLAECLTIQTSNVSPTVFKVTDYKSLVKLPNRVAFRGDNGRLLGRIDHNGTHFNQFLKNDIGDIHTMYDIVPARNGDIRVRARQLNKFWRLRTTSWTWILSESTDSSENNPHNMFEVIKVAPNVIALRNRGNNQFCKRLSGSGRDSGLAAISPTIDNFARIQVVEPIIQRSINVLHFRLDEARIYDDTIIVVAQQEAENYKSVPDTSFLKFSEIITDTSSWSNSISVATGVSFSLTTGIPKIGLGAEINIETSMTESYTWGKEKTQVREIENSYTVTISPKCKATVKLLARKGTCDVPFSYSQSDLYADGERPTPVTMEDGIYIGANAYHFYYQSREQPLSALELAQVTEETVIVRKVPLPVVEQPLPTLDIPEEQVPVLDIPDQSVVEVPLSALDIPQSVVEEQVSALDIPKSVVEDPLPAVDIPNSLVNPDPEQEVK